MIVTIRRLVAAVMLLPLVVAARAAPDRTFSVAAGPGAAAPVYLVKTVDGGDSGDSLTIWAKDRAGHSQKVFTAETFLLEKVVAMKDGSGVIVIGKSSDSEGWAPHAASYDPYHIYRIVGAAPAYYDLASSRDYTQAHYCPWKGPQYDENYGAVQITDTVCRTMTRAEFDAYAKLHPERFR